MGRGHGVSWGRHPERRLYRLDILAQNVIGALVEDVDYRVVREPHLCARVVGEPRLARDFKATTCQQVTSLVDLHAGQSTDVGSRCSRN